MATIRDAGTRTNRRNRKDVASFRLVERRITVILSSKLLLDGELSVLYGEKGRPFAKPHIFSIIVQGQLVFNQFFVFLAG